MPRQTLKQKLKAADRRRKRRSTKTPETNSPAPHQATDVFGLIVSAILESVDSSRSEVRDAAVISAIRGYLKGGTTDEPSLTICEQFERIVQRKDVDARAFRDALQQMLKLAQQFRDSRNSSAFIKYLGIMAG